MIPTQPARAEPRWPVTLGGSLLPGAVAWTIGISLGQSALISLVVLAMIGGYHLLPDVRNLEWPPLEHERTVRARRDVSRLSWALTGTGGMVPMSGVITLERLAADRLALRGIDLSDRSRIATLLGPEMVMILSERPNTMRYSTFSRCVTALEGLEHVPLAPHTGVTIPEGLIDGES